jgi:hypothetical protein
VRQKRVDDLCPGCPQSSEAPLDGPARFAIGNLNSDPAPLPQKNVFGMNNRSDSGVSNIVKYRLRMRSCLALCIIMFFADAAIQYCG